MAQSQKENAAAEQAEAPVDNAPRIRWDGSKMRTTYANVVNVSSTMEEVTMLFGTNQTWHSGQDLTIQLEERIILNPYAAKRLSTLLSNVLAEYESRFGELKIDAAVPAAPEAGKK